MVGNIELIMRDIEQVQDMLKAFYEDIKFREEHEELADALEEVNDILNETYKTIEDMENQYYDDNN